MVFELQEKSHSRKKMPDGRSLGKVKREKYTTVEVLGRRLLVWVREYESGVQRCSAFFDDRDKKSLTRQNMLLRAKIQKIEAEKKSYSGGSGSIPGQKEEGVHTQSGGSLVAERST